MTRQIVYNAVECLKCDQIISSRHVHDYARRDLTESIGITSIQNRIKSEV